MDCRAILVVFLIGVFAFPAYPNMVDADVGDNENIIEIGVTDPSLIMYTSYKDGIYYLYERATDKDDSISVFYMYRPPVDPDQFAEDIKLSFNRAFHKSEQFSAAWSVGAVSRKWDDDGVIQSRVMPEIGFETIFKWTYFIPMKFALGHYFSRADNVYWFNPKARNVLLINDNLEVAVAVWGAGNSGTVVSLYAAIYRF